MSSCALGCGNPITPEELDDPEAVYREVTSWVHGPKLQGPVLRTQTGRLAHRACVQKLIDGEAVDQEKLPGFETVHDHTCSEECMESDEHMRAMEEDARRQVEELENPGPPISMWSPAPWESMY